MIEARSDDSTSQPVRPADGFLQRSELAPTTGLMIAEAGSLGNHQHANSITTELYGLGLPLAPDSGIGTNYFEADHAEYYSQFPPTTRSS